MARLADRYVEQEQQILDRHEALEHCLQRLQAPQRRLVERYYGSSEKVPKIASEMGRSTNAVYKTLRRIRLSLFRCVSTHLAGEVSA